MSHGYGVFSDWLLHRIQASDWLRVFHNLGEVSGTDKKFRHILRGNFQPIRSLDSAYSASDCPVCRVQAFGWSKISTRNFLGLVSGSWKLAKIRTSCLRKEVFFCCKKNNCLYHPFWIFQRSGLLPSPQGSFKSPQNWRIKSAGIFRLLVWPTS